jgi:hypothetical protein
MTKGWSRAKYLWIAIVGFFLCAVVVVFAKMTGPRSIIIHALQSAAGIATSTDPQKVDPPSFSPVDTAAYDAKILSIANIQTKIVIVTVTSTIPGTTTIQRIKVSKTVPLLNGWPVKTVYPNVGALLPFNRIVAYYGNFYSKQMGVLGEYPPDQMIQMLQDAVAQWKAADPNTPVIPAIDYIAVTAQASGGADGKYRARMPASQIDEAITLANKVNGIVFLDIQVGLSNVQTEIPLLEKYLKMPNIELSIDPEFSMKDGSKPGIEIGTFDASDINYCANYLANLVRQNKLPPKILVVHRFTEDMVTHYKQITPLPEVQVVMDMDGWGQPAKKVNTYQQFIEGEPIQFTGFKLFYKADLRAPSTRMMTPAEVLKLSPQPIYIQYQ